MKLPLQRIAVTADGALLVAAFGHHLQVFDLASGDLLSSTLPRAETAEPHNGLVRLVVVHEGPARRVVITSGEDKLLKVWELPTLALLSSRGLRKRATSLAVSPDGKLIAVADKFGDIYNYGWDGTEEPASVVPDPDSVDDDDEEGGDPRHAPIAGHVSMLTSLLLISHPAFSFPLLISADRDEHIRASAFPKAWHIHRFLLGHTAFVGALGWLPLGGEEGGLLLSGGGEDSISIWDVKSGSRVGQVVVDRLKEGLSVSPNKEPWDRKVGRKGKRKINSKAKLGSEAPEGNGSATPDVSFADAEPLPKRNCINKIVIGLSGSTGRRTIFATSTGSSLLAVFSSPEPDSPILTPVRYFNAGVPILDATPLPDGRVLLSVDETVATSASTPSGPRPIRCLAVSDSDIRDVTLESSGIASLAALASSEGSSSNPMATVDALYPELALFSKDAEAGEGRRSETKGGSQPLNKKVRSDDGRTGKRYEGRAKGRALLEEALNEGVGS